MSSSQATVLQLNTAPGACRCRFGRRAKAHHDQLLRLEHDRDELLELLDLAVTWGELDYSDRQIIPPNRWLEFARAHTWDDPERAERVMSLATDIAMGALRAGRARSRHDFSAAQ